MAALTATSSPAPANQHLPIPDYHEDDSHHKAYASSERTTPSRRQSGFTNISSIPPSLPADDIPYIHRKHRQAFRSPSSVRAIQLSSPSPVASPRHSLSDTRKWSLAAVHKYGPRDDLHSEPATSEPEHGSHLRHRPDSGAKLYRAPSDTTTNLTSFTESRPPLILLHVSVLRGAETRYSRSLLEAHAPRYVQDNLRLLAEKLSDEVVARGVLLPHPGDEYEMLEERLLEALELVPPRVLDCGHFYDPEMDEAEEMGDDRSTVGDGGEMKTICSYAHAEMDGAPDEIARDPVCDTCAQPMHLPSRGAGHGSQRWEINFYAANGLMRAGAWAAAWREMERVDVEIAPWMSSSVKRTMEMAAAKEEEKSATERREFELQIDMLQMDVKEAAQRIHELEDDLVKLQTEREQSIQVPVSTSGDGSKELPTTSTIIPPDLIQISTIPLLNESLSSVEATTKPERLAQDIPLGRLLQRYVMLWAQDRRNIALFIMSVVVLFLGMALVSKTGSSNAILPPTLAPTLPSAQISPVVEYQVPQLSTSQNLTSARPIVAEAIVPDDVKLQIQEPIEVLEPENSEPQASAMLPLSNESRQQSAQAQPSGEGQDPVLEKIYPSIPV
ncbi:hypothetical protein BT63DRAFT_68894 [Microthyrium microscopicum]|uniref:Uncharacterized protein n=1 Tax=Microthyrium microscopicum TaxID=703497 RepID=A0A6A6U382_9PEZI|nr:hypothetical protein BT63DRAFT_68894 [Microthyrium microscopicum]